MLLKDDVIEEIVRADEEEIASDDMIALAAHGTAANAEIARLMAEVDALTAERDKYRRRKDEAYEERNRVVLALCRIAFALGWPVGRGKHTPDPDPSWDPEWLTLIYVEVPGVGQCGWHVHDSQAHLFADLPLYDAAWDGTTTAQKYERLAAWKPTGLALCDAFAELLEHVGLIEGRMPHQHKPRCFFMEHRGQCDCGFEEAEDLRDAHRHAEELLA